MAKQELDLNALAKKNINTAVDPYYKTGKAASDGGKLKLVSEQICQPFNGYAFKLDKGQVIRYECIDGPQILDTIYHVRSRPTEEYACTYHSTLMGSILPYEGMHYYSNTPFMRPLATIIKDTVDIEKVKEKYGARAGTNFIYNGGRCTSAIWEGLGYGPNCNSCDMNLKDGLVKALGEEDARKINTPAAFMHFQVIAFDKIPMDLTYYPNRDMIKPGDYVELLAHEDLWAIVSPCPLGDQNDQGDFKEWVNWPFRVAIYEGADGPLLTASDPMYRTMDPIDFIKMGRPGMVHGKVGTPK